MTGTLRIHGVSRRRLGTDGHGITDLVSMPGCPLSCDYCLNKDILATGRVHEVTCEELLSMVMEEACYFVATGGGVAFGGGEPLLQWEGLCRFVRIMPSWMGLTVETSLQAPREAVESLIPHVGLWVVDVKSLDPSVYEGYAHGSLSVAMSNLEILHDVSDRVRIRVPAIPGNKDMETALAEGEEIRTMGFNDVDVFQYVIR